MIKKVQVLWYLNKEDLESYCIDFKEYKSHKLEGYEICDVDEDLIYDLCDINPDRIEPLGYFKNIKEIENKIKDYLEFELDLDPNEHLDKVMETVEFTGEDYYLSIGDGIDQEGNVIVSWFNSLKKEYARGLKEDLWVVRVTGYDPYSLSLTGRTLAHILSDILNINEASLDKYVPHKGPISIEEWNSVVDTIYKKNKIYLGLNRVI